MPGPTRAVMRGHQTPGAADRPPTRAGRRPPVNASAAHTVANAAWRARWWLSVCAISASGTAAPASSIQSARVAAIDATRLRRLARHHQRGHRWGHPGWQRRIRDPAPAPRAHSSRRNRTTTPPPCAARFCVATAWSRSERRSASESGRSPGSTGRSAGSAECDSRCTASVALMNPAMPAAASRCPRLVFDRPQRARMLAAAIRFRERLEFDRITQNGCGAVGLDVVHRARRHVSRAQRIGDHVALGQRVRRGHPVRSAILVDGRTPHHRQHPVPVADGVHQSLEHHHPGALAAHESVRARVECLAPPLGRQQSPCRDGDLGLRTQDDVDSACQCHVALPQPQALAGQVHRHQRRRTRRVDRHRGPTQPQQIGDAAHRHAVRVAGSGVGADRLGTLRAERLWYSL